MDEPLAPEPSRKPLPRRVLLIAVEVILILVTVGLILAICLPAMLSSS